MAFKDICPETNPLHEAGGCGDCGYGADFKVKLHRDDVLQQSECLLIWEVHAPPPPKVLPLIQMIAKLFHVVASWKSEELMLSVLSDFLIAPTEVLVVTPP